MTSLKVLNNFTDIGVYVEIYLLGQKFSFKMRNSCDKNDVGEYTFNDHVVYFTIALAMDVEPITYTKRIDIEWRMKGERRMVMNKLGSFETVTLGVFYHL